MTKQVLLRFEREALLHDIQNYAYIEGDIMERDNEHAKHQVFDIGEDGNIDRVTRVLDLTFAQCVELCYPYSKRDVRDHSSRDNELEEEDEYVMRLSVPPAFSETTVTLLSKCIHELLVCSVLADWLSITKPESKENWQEKINTIEQQIRDILNTRTGRVHRPITPF